MRNPKDIDDKLTLERLERDHALLLKAPPSRQRDEMLRLNAFGRALLETAGVNSVGELIRATPVLADLGSKKNSN